MSGQKILIIENQVTQFKLIQKELKRGGYDTYPSEAEYIPFINLVRILLNKRYGRRTKKAKELFMQEVGRIDADLFLVDHILVGCHDGENGIDLAKKLRTEGFAAPVLFFSRTPDSERKVCKDMADMKLPYFWMTKGYAKMGMTEENYFDDMVFPRIKTLMPLEDADRYMPILEKINLSISNKSQRELFEPKYEVIKQKFILTEVQKKLLDDYENTADIRKARLLDSTIEKL